MNTIVFILLVLLLIYAVYILFKGVNHIKMAFWSGFKQYGDEKKIPKKLRETLKPRFK
jgi:thiosulfate reductase cytochrome b subunit